MKSPKPEVKLKRAIKNAGLKIREVADYIDHPYGTLACWLNGFSPMPDHARRKIEILVYSCREHDETLCSYITRTAKIDPLYDLARELFDIGITEQEFSNTIKKEGEAGEIIEYADRWKVQNHLRAIWEELG